jgi:hypothetical protein
MRRVIEMGCGILYGGTTMNDNLSIEFQILSNPAAQLPIIYLNACGIVHNFFQDPVKLIFIF